MRRYEAWARRLRPVPLLAAIGVALGGCPCCGPRHFGEDDRKPGYSITPASEQERLKAQAPRAKW